MTDIEQAYHLITPIAGGAAALLFGIALLASGQSSTLTGTIAGQVIMDGFLHTKIPCYQRRLITRGRARAGADRRAVAATARWGSCSCGARCC